ncbi:MAG: MoaD/ThiS family protein [Flavobacterium sp.]|nr:MoaD/ThiS family protein [Flavobacterium sp.]
MAELLEDLFLRYPNLKTKHFQVAQNKEIVPIATKITTNEIALLPPFAGG